MKLRNGLNELSNINKKVICITGPTASGKTSLSIKIAKALQTEIINVDRIQMMKLFDIGSAKVTNSEMEGIKHHLIDFLDINEDYTIYNFQKDAREKIDEISIPLFVGGSGLYLKSALYNYELTSDHLDNNKQKENTFPSILKMYNEIKLTDPEYRVHPNNHQRIQRAYELIKEGIKPSAKVNKDEPLYDILIIYLDIDRNVLEERLIKRLKIMFSQGFISEVINLKKIGANLNVIGYREVSAYLDGKISFKQCQDLIIKNSMAYAKRQKTWFKNQTNATIIDALSKDFVTKSLDVIYNFLEKGGA